MLGRKRWTPVTGKVIASEVIGNYGRPPGGLPRSKYIVEYTDADGASQRAEVAQVGRFIRWMISPSPGTTVPLLVNGAGKVRFDHKDPAINTFADQKRQKATRRDRWDEELRGG